MSNLDCVPGDYCSSLQEQCAPKISNSQLCDTDAADGPSNSCLSGFCSADNECAPAPENIVGGKLVQIESSSLVLVGAQLTASWLIPIILSGIGISIVFLKRTNPI